jgi:uncharacterized protein YndB with AHSA1/START domain
VPRDLPGATVNALGAGEGSMVDVVRTLVVDRAPADCFDFLVDLERLADWQRGSGIRRVIVRGDDPIGLGTRFRLEGRFAARRRVWIDAAVSTFDRPSRFGYRSSGWRSFSLSVDATITPSDKGTGIEWHLSLETPRALRPFAPLIGREIGHRVDVDLAVLRGLLDGRADTTAGAGGDGPR